MPGRPKSIPACRFIERMDNKARKTLLAVLAHPDDESFGMGGTLALYARQDVDVYLICATRGEVGTVDPKYMAGFHSVAELRESELRCAAGYLCLKGVYFLDYRDSGMPGSNDNQHPQALAAQPVEEVAVRVAEFIRKLRPQVVLTFDPIGGYKHPDHIAIHRATVRAFELAGAPALVTQYPPYQPSKLYFHVMPKGMFKVVVRLLPLLGQDPRRFGRNHDINLIDLVEDGDFPIHARINYRPVREERDAAAACHASQSDGTPARGPLRWARLLFGNQDLFMRSVPPARSGLREKDLFAGV